MDIPVLIQIYYWLVIELLADKVTYDSCTCSLGRDDTPRGEPPTWILISIKSSSLQSKRRMRVPPIMLDMIKFDTMSLD